MYGSPIIQNLTDFWQDVSKNSTFEIYQSSQVLALKSPTKMSGVHFVWGTITSKTISEVKNFFGDCPFGWIVPSLQPHEEKQLKKSGFSEPYYFPEMCLELQNFYIPTFTSPIQIQQINKTDPELLESWIQIAAEGFGLAPDEVQNFISSTLSLQRQCIYIAFWNNRPAATALMYLGNETAGLYFLTVSLPFRKKGLGRAITYACLKNAQEAGLTKAVLYSSQMAISLYGSIGFRILGEYCECTFDPLKI